MPSSDGRCLIENPSIFGGVLEQAQTNRISDTLFSSQIYIIVHNEILDMYKIVVT